MLLFVVSLYFFNWKTVENFLYFLTRCNSMFWKDVRVYLFFVENVRIFVKMNKRGKRSGGRCDSGATEMKRKRRNVDTRAGKKCIFRMEFSGNTRRYTMGHQLQ